MPDVLGVEPQVGVVSATHCYLGRARDCLIDAVIGYHTSVLSAKALNTRVSITSQMAQMNRMPVRVDITLSS